MRKTSPQRLFQSSVAAGGSRRTSDESQRERTSAAEVLQAVQHNGAFPLIRTMGGWAVGGVAVLCGLLLPLTHALAQSADPLTDPFSRTDYRNQIFTGPPTNTAGAALGQTASVAFYSGNIGNPTNTVSTNLVTPNDGQIYLTQSIIGQPVGLAAVPFKLIVQEGTGRITPAPDATTDGSWFQLYQRVALTARPGRYFKFLGWSDGGADNPRQVTTGPTNGYTAIFTSANGVTLFTTNIQGYAYVGELGKPLVFVNDQFYPDDVVVTNSGAQIRVTVVATYPNGSNRYTVDDSNPVVSPTATNYTGPFMVTAPLKIRAVGYTASSTDPKSADPIYSLDISTPGGGSLVAVAQTDFYDGSASTVLTATPNAGWSFLNWAGEVGDVTATDPVITLPVNRSKSVVAIFGTSVVPGVNDISLGYVTNMPAQPLYAYGSLVRLGAVPFAGSGFGSWGGSNVVSGNTSNPLDFTVTNAIPAIQGIFGPLEGKQSLTILPLGDGGVVRSPSANNYATGTNVTLTATNPPGQHFVSWSGDASGTNSPMTITMTNSKLIYASFAVTQPTFSLSAATYSVNEADGFLEVTVTNRGAFGGAVSFATEDGSAKAGVGFVGDYTRTDGVITFASGLSSQKISVPIRDQFLHLPDKSFQFKLSNPNDGGVLATPSNATVTIRYNTTLSTTGSQLVQAYPGPLPTLNGALQVGMSPSNLGAQWRFRWEDEWRSEFETVTNLEAGDYDLDFREVAGFLPQDRTRVTTVSPGSNIFVETYLQTLDTGIGRLRILPEIYTPWPPGGSWRLRGDRAWKAAESFREALVPGIYEVQFATVQGYAAPTLNLIPKYPNFVEIPASTITPPRVSYTPLPSTPTNAPTPLTSFNQINVTPTDLPRMPYAFNGQLSSPLNGHGSGVAVSSNVVLTAAHLVFDYDALKYIGPVYWSFQKHEGEFSPRPLSARGWNLMSGYSAARGVDRTNGFPSSQSSLQSWNFDVAALYFREPVARGGYGGYLASDAATNEWLAGSAAKMLVGYPVDASLDGYTNIVPGKMHATTFWTNGCSVVSDQVYSTTSMVSFGGNSGGPVYVQHTNSLFYPAAVYVGRSGPAVAMRAIDSNVVNLIARSALLGDLGTNNGSGGVITLVGPLVTPANPALVQVPLGPEIVVLAGAGWRLSGEPTYGSTAGYTRPVTSSNAFIEFNPVPGWESPSISTQRVVPGVINTIPGANYTFIPPRLSLVVGVSTNAKWWLAMTGSVDAKYRIEYRTNLGVGPWFSQQTNVLVPGTNLLVPLPPTNRLPAAFYRAVWMP